MKRRRNVRCRNGTAPRCPAPNRRCRNVPPPILRLHMNKIIYFLTFLNFPLTWFQFSFMKMYIWTCIFLYTGAFKGEVSKFRKSLWLEHMGPKAPIDLKPEDRKCTRTVLHRAKANLLRYINTSAELPTGIHTFSNGHLTLKFNS